MPDKYIMRDDYLRELALRPVEIKPKPWKGTKMTPEQQATDWNENYPVGTKVHLTDDDGETIETITTSPAWVIGGHSALVSVSGISGGYDLNRINPINEGGVEVRRAP